MSLATIGKSIAAKYAAGKGQSNGGPRLNAAPQIPDNKYAAGAFATPASQSAHKTSVPAAKL